MTVCVEVSMGSREIKQFLAELSNKINKRDESHTKLLVKWGFRLSGVADKSGGYKQRTISELAGN